MRFVKKVAWRSKVSKIHSLSKTRGVTLSSYDRLMIRTAEERPTLQNEARELARQAAVMAASTMQSAIVVLKRLITPVSIGALIADDSGRFVTVNAAAAELTGYTILDLMKLSVWQITPDSNEHEAETLWRAFRQRREQHGEYQ